VTADESARLRDPAKPETLKQCKSCPWRVDCVPDRDIPNYQRDLHENLDNTIAKPGDVATAFCSVQHLMACHYSKPQAEFPCAGWLHHQLGTGNNIGVRLRVMSGHLPVPEVDGPQHETFEDTLCSMPSRRTRRKKSRR